IVKISAFGVRKLAEHSVLHHSQHHHFGCAITAVLENKAVLACDFGGIHRFPTLFDGGERRNFDGCMLAIFHRAHRHWGVPVPGSSDVNDVEIELGKIFEVPLALAETRRLRLARISYGFLRVSHFFRHKVADRFDLYVFYCEEIFQQAASAAAYANNSQADVFSWLERDAHHGCGATLLCLSVEFATQNVARNQQPRTAGHAALHEMSP